MSMSGWEKRAVRKSFEEDSTRCFAVFWFVVGVCEPNALANERRSIMLELAGAALLFGNDIERRDRQ
jgi:hypothetical protein